MRQIDRRVVDSAREGKKQDGISTSSLSTNFVGPGTFFQTRIFGYY